MDPRITLGKAVGNIWNFICDVFVTLGTASNRRRFLVPCSGA